MNNRLVKILSVVAIVFLLTISLTSVALAQQGDGNQQGKGDHQQERAQNMARAEEKNWFGQFKLENGSVEGRFVKFEYNDTSGSISNFQVYTGESYITIFEKVTVENFVPDGTHISDAVFSMNGTHIKIMIHNNPRAIMQIVNPYDDTPLKINYDVNENIEVQEGIDIIGEGSHRSSFAYQLIGEGFNGVINTPLNTTLEDNVINVDGEGWNETAHSMFMSKPSFTNVPKAHQNRVQNAVMNGTVGAEMEIVGKGQGHASHKVQYRQNLEMQVMNMEEKKLRVRVQSEDPNGTCVMLRVEKQSLNLEQNQIQLKLDGEKVEKASFEKVLQGGEQARYSVQEQEDGMLEIAVNVPHFSEHEITVEAESVTPGYTLPMLLIAIGGVAVIWGIRKKSN